MSDPRDFAPSGAIRAAAYRFLWACSNALSSASNGFLYLAAGLLRRSEMEQANRIMWREYGTSAEEHVDSGLEAWERRLYGEMLRRDDRILLIGSGAGRDLLALRELGHEITGLEPVPELVTLSRENLRKRKLAAVVLSAPVQEARLEGQFDVMVFSPGIYSCVPGSAQRVATLRRLRNHLVPGGRMLVSYCAFVRQSRFSRWVTRAGTLVGRADWRPERGDVFSRDHAARRVLRFEHLFSPGDVRRECEAAGLHVVRDRLESSPFHCLVAET